MVFRFSNQSTYMSECPPAPDTISPQTLNSCCEASEIFIALCLFHSLLFLSVSDNYFLTLGGSLSPIHIFKWLDDNISCGIRSLDIKYRIHVAEHTLFTFL